jgi:hypothetical protein
MSMDQCAQNPDGSLKDPNDIQWYHDKDDARPLPSITIPARPLGCGLHNKTANRFLDAVAHEQLGSDDEDLNALARPTKRKGAPRTSKMSGGVASSTLSLTSKKTSETLLVEESSDDEKDESFQADSGSDSGDNSGSTDLELISNNEVRVALFFYNLKSLSNVLLAR